MFNHLVDSPRRYPGGVLFTVDQHAVQRTIWVTDAAIARLDGSARDDIALVRAVMSHVRELVDLALAKASTQTMPELIVLDEESIAAVVSHH